MVDDALSLFLLLLLLLLLQPWLASSPSLLPHSRYVSYTHLLPTIPLSLQLLPQPHSLFMLSLNPRQNEIDELLSIYILVFSKCLNLTLKIWNRNFKLFTVPSPFEGLVNAHPKAFSWSLTNVSPRMGILILQTHTCLETVSKTNSWTLLSKTRITPGNNWGRRYYFAYAYSLHKACFAHL